MSLVNIGIAGCLGRMGSYLVKEIIYDKRLNFSGGFEDPKHENINKKISELIGVKTEHIVHNDSEKIFSQSDVVIDYHVLGKNKKVGTSAISPCLGSPLFRALTTWSEDNILGVEIFVNDILMFWRIFFRRHFAAKD